MRRQRETAAAVIEISDDDENSKSHVEQPQQQTDENNNKPENAADRKQSQQQQQQQQQNSVSSSSATSRVIDTIMSTRRKELFEVVRSTIPKQQQQSKNKTTNLIQKPLFYDQRLESVCADLVKNEMHIVLAPKFIEDQGSVFFSFCCLGAKTQKQLQLLEKFVRTFTEISGKKSIHGCMFAGAIQVASEEEARSQQRGFDKELIEAAVSKRGNSNSSPLLLQPQDDDGEEFADQRLRSMLNSANFLGLGLMNPTATWSDWIKRGLVVTCTRWYGGVLLGPARFRHIESCAKSALLEMQRSLSQI